MTKDNKMNLEEVDTGFRIPDGDYQKSIDKHLTRLSFVKVTADLQQEATQVMVFRMFSLKIQ